MADNHLPDHLAAIEEAAQLLESAAAHNRAKGRTVLVKEQQDRADRLRAAHSFLTASRTPVADGAALDLPSLAAQIQNLAEESEAKRQVEENPYVERIHLGMREGYSHAARLVIHYLRKQAKEAALQEIIDIGQEIENSGRKQAGQVGSGAVLIEAGALRQFQHNDGSGLIFGYDKAITDRVTAHAEKDAERFHWLEQNRTWRTRYRIKGGKPIEWQMLDDGEPWGQWGELRNVIDAARAVVASRYRVEGGHGAPEASNLSQEGEQPTINKGEN